LTLDRSFAQRQDAKRDRLSGRDFRNHDTAAF
jgi:hypothetical protein